MSIFPIVANAIMDRRNAEGDAFPCTDGDITYKAFVLQKAWVELLEEILALIQADRLGPALSADEAEDVRSASLLKLVHALVEARPDDAPFSEEWLQSLIQGEIRNHFDHRRKSRQIRLLDSKWLASLATIDAKDAAAYGHSEHSPAALARDRRRRTRLRGVVKAVRGRVSERTWSAFWSITVDGLSIEVAAALHGMTYWAAQKANVRIRESLKAEAARRGIE